MKSALALAAALFGTLAASPGFAQEGEAPAPAAAAQASEAPAAETEAPAAPAPVAAIEAPAAAAKQGTFGLQLDLIPTGKLTARDGSRTDSADAATTFGVSAVLDFDVTPNFSLGVAPRLVLGVKPDAAKDSANELDLRARAALHTAISPTAQGYAFLEPGYSMIFLPTGAKIDNPSGFVLALGAGASFDVSPDVFLAAEIGYQFGFQGSTFQGRDIDFSSDLLHIGIGGGTRF